MKKIIIKIFVLIVVFSVGLLCMNYFSNQTSTAMTEKMSEATLPVIFLEKQGIAYNPLYGYLADVDLEYMRDSITQLSTNREIEFTIDTYGADIKNVTYELRNLDGSRLIENGNILELTKRNTEISGSFGLKDLIEQGVEYKLIFLITTSEYQEIRYITTVIWDDTLYQYEKLEYMQYFHNQTFDKEAATELTMYLESNSSGDNSGFQYVNINSSFDQITWGDLEVTRVCDPMITITELDEQTAFGTISYLIQTEIDNRVDTYWVEEYYRVRYTSTRMYLLAFERTVEQYFDIEAGNYNGSTISFGIVNRDLEIIESEDGNNKAFIINNSLYTYSVADDRIAEVFTFYNASEIDIRNSIDEHTISVLQVSESGNIIYAIYGYMNRGSREGEVGIQIMQYDSSANTNTERLWIPYQKSSAILQAELDQLLYLNANEKLFLKIESKVYSVDLQDYTVTEVVQFSVDESIYISKNSQLVVYQTGQDVYKSDQVVLLDLKNTKAYTVYTDIDEYIIPLGFIGQDAVVGRAYMEDVAGSNNAIAFPMYQINIINSEGKIIKTYEKEGVYITECIVETEQLILEQAYKNSAGQYVEIESEYIKNNEIIASNSLAQTIVAGIMQTQLQLKVNKTIDIENLKYMYSENVILEGTFEILLDTQDTQRYYVYGLNGLEQIYMKPSDAVKKATELSGVVIGESGEYIWRKTQLSTSNQIMAISGSQVTEEKNSVAVCLDTVLGYEGIIRNSEYYLEKGYSVQEMLEENLEDVQVLNLEDTTLDSLLYYVNLDLPVLTTLQDGNAILIIGFNTYNIVIMDPNTGEVYKMGMTDATEWLNEQVNASYTYIPIN